MLSVEEIKAIIDCVEYKDWQFEVVHSPADAIVKYIYIQVSFIATDMRSGRESSWTGRKWLVSTRSTRSEIVQTCLKAVLTAEEHEARESFKYKSKAIFGPHLDVEWMAEHAGALDARTQLF